MSASSQMLKCVKYHLIIFYYYSELLYNLQIYFKSRNNYRFKDIIFDKPMYRLSAIFFSGLMALLAASYLLIKDFNYKTTPIAIPIEILPLYGRVYYLIIILSWSLMTILYHSYALKSNLLFYTLLAVFTVNDNINSKITPEDLSKISKNLFNLIIMESFYLRTQQKPI